MWVVHSFPRKKSFYYLKTFMRPFSATSATRRGESSGVKVLWAMFCTLKNVFGRDLHRNIKSWGSGGFGQKPHLFIYWLCCNIYNDPSHTHHLVWSNLLFSIEFYQVTANFLQNICSGVNWVCKARNFYSTLLSAWQCASTDAKPFSCRYFFKVTNITTSGTASGKIFFISSAETPESHSF